MPSATGRLALLPEEPAGLIPTRTPGAVRFEAKLTWRSPEEAMPGKVLPSLPRGVKVYITEPDEPGENRWISGEIRAFAERDLDDALDSILRAVTSAAALSEAVLEVRTVRVARPRIVSRDVLGGLARGMWESGFGVRFGPCWTPLWDGVEAAVGTRDLEDAHERIRILGPWEIASRPL